MTAKALDSLRAAKRIVVKIGSALVAEDGRARQDWLNSLAQDMSAHRAAGQDVILVSSGAIALGRDRLGPDRPRKLEEKTSRCGSRATALDGGALKSVRRA